LVFLNNDTIVTREWLSRLVFHATRPDVGVVCSITNYSGNESCVPVSYQSIHDIDSFAEAYTHQHVGELVDIRSAPLLAAAMRRVVFLEVGLLDEDYGLGMFEDDDLAMRVRAAGYRVVCADDSFVHHWGSASFSKLSQQVYVRTFETNRRRFEGKWGIRWEPHSYRDGSAPRFVSTRDPMADPEPLAAGQM
jgi:GT2 family glycosyltransferase